MIRCSSPNHDARPADAPVDMLVLHYTGMPSMQAALDRLCDPSTKVSAHYLVDEDGAVYALVEEARRAWHAGLSCWRGQRDVNARSIGIELVNPGHEFGYRRFPAAQMTALAELARGILARHPIPPRNVVGHADVAPKRKQDPGELFDWQWLAGRNVGLWPASAVAATVPASSEMVRRELAVWGYDVPEGDDAKAALTAFQRHFRPACCDGVADGETMARLRGLLAIV